MIKVLLLSCYYDDENSAETKSLGYSNTVGAHNIIKSIDTILYYEVLKWKTF